MLETGNGAVIGDPVNAHRELTGAFRASFMGPEWSRVQVHEGNYFTGGTDSEGAFMQDTQNTRVPDTLRRLIHEAIQRVPESDKIQQDLEAALAEVSTMDELTKAIRKAKVNSSAVMKNTRGLLYTRLHDGQCRGLTMRRRDSDCGGTTMRHQPEEGTG